MRSGWSWAAAAGVVTPNSLDCSGPPGNPSALLGAGSRVGYHADMSKSIWRWATLGAAFFVIGPIAARAIGSLATSTGAPVGSLLSASSLPAGVGVLLLIAIGAGIVAIVGAHRCSLRTGLFGAGLVVAWAAFSSAQVDVILRDRQAPGAFWLMTAEGVVLAITGLALAWAASRSGSSPPDERESHGRSNGLGFLIGVVAGALGAAAIARSEMAGQTLAAGIAAGTLGTVLGRVVDRNSPTWAYVGAIGALAIVGPAAGAVVHGDQALTALYANDLVAIARLTPLDWLAGALIGVPIGSAWAASMVEKGAEAPASA